MTSRPRRSSFPRALSVPIFSADASPRGGGRPRSSPAGATTPAVRRSHALRSRPTQRRRSPACVAGSMSACAAESDASASSPGCQRWVAIDPSAGPRPIDSGSRGLRSSRAARTSDRFASFGRPRGSRCPPPPPDQRLRSDRDRRASRSRTPRAIAPVPADGSGIEMGATASPIGWIVKLESDATTIGSVPLPGATRTIAGSPPNGNEVSRT